MSQEVEGFDGRTAGDRSPSWRAPQLTVLGELDSHTDAQTVSNSDGSLAGTLGGDEGSTS